MKTAVIVIAICEVIRTIQITIDLAVGIKGRKRVNNAFIESLKMDNKEWVENTLKEFLETQNEEKTIK